MRKSGYTLIELLVSAAIFAGVLTASFASVFSITKVSRSNEEIRQVTAVAFDLIDTIAQYARYATPAVNNQGGLACNNDGTAVKRTSREGIYLTLDQRNLYINVKTKALPPTYSVYQFSLESGSNSRYFNLQVTKWNNLPVDGEVGCNYTVSGTGYNLLAGNQIVVWDGSLNSSPFAIESISRSPTSATAGDLTLDPAQIEEAEAKVLKLNFTVAQLEGDKEVRTQVNQTAITPRFYQTSFNSY